MAIRENEEESVDGEIESGKSGREVSVVNSSSQAEGGLAKAEHPTLRTIGIPVQCSNIALLKRVMQAEFKRLRDDTRPACKSHRGVCLLIRVTRLEINTARWARLKCHISFNYKETFVNNEKIILCY